jgi:outer membrane receptor for ferrienterochelin and colicin
MSQQATPLRLTTLAAAICVAVGAHAQETQLKNAPLTKAQKADDKIQQVEVRGSAESYDPRRDDTATKIVVNHDEITKYGDTNVLDVLKRVPGVTVINNAIRMRGLGGGYTQILINGERAPAGFTMDSLSPDTIERIEVLRAATAEFSTQSVAGTINIVLKKAIKQAQREVKAGYGGGGGMSSPYVSLQMSDRAGKLSWSLPMNFFGSRSDRTSSATEQGVDAAGRTIMLRNIATESNNRWGLLNTAPRLNWNLDGGDTLTSQSFINLNRMTGDSRSDTTTSVGAPPPVPSQVTPLHNKNVYLHTDLNWVHKLASGSKLDLKVGAGEGRFESLLHRFGYAGAEPVQDSATDSDTRDHSITSTGKYTNPLIEGQTLAIGWDGGVTKRDNTYLQDDLALAGLPPYHADEVFTARVSRLAGYAQDEWNVTPRWSVYVGARWEGILTRTEGNTFDTAHSRSSVWSPVMQTLYKLPGSKADQLRFAVTRTYKAPDVQNLIPRRWPSTNNSSTQPDYMGNPNLKPELALGLDASYEHYFGEGGLFSVSGSTRRIDDFTRTLVIEQDGRWVALPSNQGQARTRGLEVELKFPLKTFFANAPAIDWRASISRNWSTVESVPGPNNRLDQQTPLSATMGIDYKAGALTLGGSFSFRNGGPVRVSAQQTSYQSVRRDLDVYALWKFDPKLQLRLALSNVLGQDWVSASSYAEPGMLVTRANISPAYVTARATLEVKF